MIPYADFPPRAVFDNKNVFLGYHTGDEHKYLSCVYSYGVLSTHFIKLSGIGRPRFFTLATIFALTSATRAA